MSLIITNPIQPSQDPASIKLLAAVYNAAYEALERAPIAPFEIKAQVELACKDWFRGKRQ